MGSMRTTRERITMDQARANHPSMGMIQAVKTSPKVRLVDIWDGWALNVVLFTVLCASLWAMGVHA